MTRVATTKKCSSCSKEFNPGSNRQLLCEKCKEKQEHIKKNTIPCPVCGKMFYCFINYKKCLTCGRTCANKLNASQPKKKVYPPQECLICKKVFTPKSDHAKFCSQRCVSKNGRLTRPEYYKERDRIKVRKQTIGIHIRDEHLGQPNKLAKWVWDGIGPWSRKYPDITECLECNTNVYRHNGNGVCDRCYDKLREKDEEKIKEYKRKSYERLKESGRPTSGVIAKTWIKKAQDREIPITPKINNLLNNLGKISNSNLKN
jgi:hypothetical protein